MTMNRMLWIFFLLLSEPGACQFSLGARATALASTTAGIKDPWNIGANPAGITGFPSMRIHANFSKFITVSDISRKSIAVVLPLKQTSLGAVFQQYGNTDYHQSQFAAALAKDFKRLSIGIGAGFTSLAITGYGASSNLSVRAGGQYALSSVLNTGLYLNYTTGASATKLSSGVGIGYTPTNRLMVSVMFSRTDQQTGIASGLGIEYQPVIGFWLRAGISTIPFKQTYGVGINLHHFTVQICLENFGAFGQIPQIEIGYAF